MKSVDGRAGDGIAGVVEDFAADGVGAFAWRACIRPGHRSCLCSSSTVTDNRDVFVGGGGDGEVGGVLAG